MRSFAGLTNVLQQPQAHMPSWGYANYTIGPLQVSFSFRVGPTNGSHVMCWCLLWCWLLLSGSHVATMFTCKG